MLDSGHQGTVHRLDVDSLPVRGHVFTEVATDVLSHGSGLDTRLTFTGLVRPAVEIGVLDALVGLSTLPVGTA